MSMVVGSFGTCGHLLLPGVSRVSGFMIGYRFLLEAGASKLKFNAAPILAKF